MGARKRIYLAGPVSNCNEWQKHAWRELTKRRHGDEFDFEDPTDFPSGLTEFALVHRDLEAIRASDAVLANMWKESIGTAFGIAHAAREGRPVVAVDPNGLQSAVLAFYSDAVVQSVHAGIHHLRDLFRLESKFRAVIKKGGGEEEFRRSKIKRSIENACRACRRDALIVPTYVLPAVIEHLAHGRSAGVKGAVTTSRIREVVWKVLAEHEANPSLRDSFVGIRQAWEEFDKRRRGGIRAPSAPERARLEERPLDVRVFATKAHKTVWDRAVRSRGDIPSPARGLFDEICRVPGIAEIRLGPFGGAHGGGPGAVAELMVSKDRRILEGKCHVQASLGGFQCFQIRVHDPAKREAIFQTLLDRLQEIGMLAGARDREA